MRNSKFQCKGTKKQIAKRILTCKKCDVVTSEKLIGTIPLNCLRPIYGLFSGHLLKISVMCQVGVPIYMPCCTKILIFGYCKEMKKVVPLHSN